MGSIPEDMFAQNPHLKEDKLADNLIGMKGLPEKLFFNNIYLEYVALGSNQLETIPATLFEKTYQPRQVYLQGNELKYLAAGIFDAKRASDERPLMPGVRVNLQDGVKIESPSQQRRRRAIVRQRGRA